MATRKKAATKKTVKVSPKKVTELTLDELTQGQVVGYLNVSYCDEGFQQVAHDYPYATLQDAIDSGDGAEAIVECRIVKRGDSRFVDLPTELPAKKRGRKAA